jgi:hypothetical protein
MDPLALKEAMKRRRGHGVDLKIIVGAPDADASQQPHGHLSTVDEEPEEEELSDLAPEVKDADKDSEDLAREEEAGEPGERAMVAHEEGEDPKGLGEYEMGEKALNEALSQHGELPMHKKMMAALMKKKPGMGGKADMNEPQSKKY